MPRKNKQAAHLSDARNIKKIKSDNELNKNASSEEEIDYDDFIYETDDSGDEWFNESMFEGLDDDAFNKLISGSKDKDVWKTGGNKSIIYHLH